MPQAQLIRGRAPRSSPRQQKSAQQKEQLREPPPLNDRRLERNRTRTLFGNTSQGRKPPPPRIIRTTYPPRRRLRSPSGSWKPRCKHCELVRWNGRCVASSARPIARLRPEFHGVERAIVDQDGRIMPSSPDARTTSIGDPCVDPPIWCFNQPDAGVAFQRR